MVLLVFSLEDLAVALDEIFLGSADLCDLLSFCLEYSHPFLQLKYLLFLQFSFFLSLCVDIGDLSLQGLLGIFLTHRQSLDLILEFFLKVFKIIDNLLLVETISCIGDPINPLPIFLDGVLLEDSPQFSLKLLVV